MPAFVSSRSPISTTLAVVRNLCEGFHFRPAERWTCHQTSRLMASTRNFAARPSETTTPATGPFDFRLDGRSKVQVAVCLPTFLSRPQAPTTLPTLVRPDSSANGRSASCFASNERPIPLDCRHPNPSWEIAAATRPTLSSLFSSRSTPWPRAPRSPASGRPPELAISSRPDDLGQWLRQQWTAREGHKPLARLFRTRARARSKVRLY